MATALPASHSAYEYFCGVSEINENMRGIRQKLLFLYIVKEMLLYFFVCFLFLFFIFFVNNILLLAEDVLSKQAPFKDVTLLMLYSLPAVIANAAPFAALIGIIAGMRNLLH